MDNLAYVGFIKKTHGFKGVVKITIEDNPRLLKITEPLMLLINKKPVPFFIEELSVNSGEALVKFEDINSSEQADELNGLQVYIEVKGKKKPAAKSISDIAGFKLMDAELGDIGIVNALIPKPGQDLMEVQYQNTTILIPLVDDFIVDVDLRKKIIYTQLPAGLIDINS